MTVATTENAVATTTQTNMAAYQEPAETGLEAMETGDLIIPRLSITQPTTEGITTEDEGKFRLNLTGETFSKMEMVLFVFNKSRQKMPDEFDRNSKPQCRSNDFISPSPDIETPLCHTCGLKPLEPGQAKKDQKHVCEYANFSMVNGKAKAPKCKESWDMLVFDYERYMPMIWSVRSKALSPVKRMASALKMLCQAKNIPACGMKFTVTVKQDPDTSKGRFFVPVLEKPVQLSLEELEVMKGIQQSIKGVEVQPESSYDQQEAPATASTKADEEF